MVNRIIKIFTDGACVNNGKKTAKAGYGIHFVDGPFEDVSEKFSLNDTVPTNQKAELYAIYKALSIINDSIMADKIVDTVEIYTDSMYSIKCLTVWSSNWIKNDWKKKVLNMDIIIMALDKISELKSKNISVKFIHVRSHTKLDTFEAINNDIADKLAVGGMNS